MFAVGGGRRTVSSSGSPSRTISNLLCIGFGGAVSVMGVFLGVVTHRGYFIVTIVTVAILLTMACCAARERWCRLLAESAARLRVRRSADKTTAGSAAGAAGSSSPMAATSASCSACSSTYIRMEAAYGMRSMSLPNIGAWNFRMRGDLRDIHDSPMTRSTSAL